MSGFKKPETQICLRKGRLPGNRKIMIGHIEMRGIIFKRRSGIARLYLLRIRTQEIIQRFTEIGENGNVKTIKVRREGRRIYILERFAADDSGGRCCHDLPESPGVNTVATICMRHRMMRIGLPVQHRIAYAMPLQHAGIGAQESLQRGGATLVAPDM